MTRREFMAAVSAAGLRAFESLGGHAVSGSLRKAQSL